MPLTFGVASTWAGAEPSAGTTETSAVLSEYVPFCDWSNRIHVPSGEKFG